MECPRFVSQRLRHNKSSGELVNVNATCICLQFCCTSGSYQASYLVRFICFNFDYHFESPTKNVNMDPSHWICFENLWRFMCSSRALSLKVSDGPQCFWSQGPDVKQNAKVEIKHIMCKKTPYSCRIPFFTADSISDSVWNKNQDHDHTSTSRSSYGRATFHSRSLPPHSIKSTIFE